MPEDTLQPFQEMETTPKKNRRAEKESQQRSRRRRVLMNRLGGWLVVALVIGGVAWGLSQMGGGVEAPAQTILTDAVSDSDWVKGSGDAPMVLVEYGDFQCPACASFYPVVKRLAEEMGDKLRIVFRHFPLRQNHPHAQLAAHAAEAAGRQGKFWEMHDMLFERQSSWSKDINAQTTFVEYASSLGLDAERFRDDLKSPDLENKIESHVQSGQRAGVRGTPTFFLNGKQLHTPRSYDEFKEVIEKGEQD
jgi:protein-disulfide isomerase